MVFFLIHFTHVARRECIAQHDIQERKFYLILDLSFGFLILYFLVNRKLLSLMYSTVNIFSLKFVFIFI